MVHETIYQALYVDPASPWQRGSNANTNGLLRQYSPRAPTCPSTPATTSMPSPVPRRTGRIASLVEAVRQSPV